MKNTANIFSFDGGGIRGIIELVQLVEFEKKLGEPILNYFQYFSGTSTGSIIAILLSIGYTAKEILDLYVNHGDKIFDKKFLRFGLLRSKYDDTYFNNIIEEYTKGKELKDTQATILIPSYNITKKDKVLFKSHKAKEDPNYNFKLKDIMRTSSSAPSYFDCYKINNEDYVDGGLVINNPSLMMLIEVMKLNKKNNLNYDTFNLISFSSGTKKDKISVKDINGGILRSVDDIIDIMLTEQSKLTDYTLQLLYELLEDLFGKKLGTYTRCNSKIYYSSGKIDDVSESNIKNMILDGQISYGINKQKILDFITILKS